jgi:CubicO group peptidase (beta-lactamase class C family)
MAHRRIRADSSTIISLVAIVVVILSSAEVHALSTPKELRRTRVSIKDTRWHLNGHLTYPAAQAEGLLMNVRMVNAVFEDRKRPDFDADGNTDEFIAAIPDYVAHGVRAFTVNLQGGAPGYEGAVNSAFNPDGSLRKGYLQRVRRVIEACDRSGVAVILGCYYQRQDQILKDAQAVRAGVVNVVRWITESGFSNVVLEIANEFNHSGFDHAILKEPEGQVELIRLAKKTSPKLLVSTSGLGDGRLPDDVARASDFLLIHFNGTKLDDIPKRIQALRKYGKPIVCNEDDKHGIEAAEAAQLGVRHGASWGFMHNELNQHFPFQFKGAQDDPVVYGMLKTLTTPNGLAIPALEEVAAYFPPPESKGGWRKLGDPNDIRRLGGMDPAKLNDLKQWLLKSDERGFAAGVIRKGYIVLEVERGNSSKTDSRRVASVSKAICATVLAIASEQSQQGLTPRKMNFDDPAFDFIPWAKPLSDPRKAKIRVRQLLNHTSGICPEATGARNDGTWQYIFGHSGDERTTRLAFDPGTACGYSTHALAHAALVCECVTGEPYDEFAVEALFKPIGCEHWWFQYYDGGKEIGRHPSHGMGMPARDLARIAYCMMRSGRWGDTQVIPKWFVEQTAQPSHNVTTPEMRFKIPGQTFSLGWELPALLTGENGTPSGKGIPADARYKPGSGGQLIAFVPSLNLVITRQTGSSGDWQYAEYLRRACAAALAE